MMAGERTVDNVVAIAVAAIDEGERLRAVDPSWAEGLARVLARDGQLTPIEVAKVPGDGRYLLVSGAHRLAAARKLQWETIRALVVSADAAERRLREVSENLWRRELEPLDRAAFVAELVQLQRIADGTAGKSAQEVAAEARWDGTKALRVEAVNASATIADAYNLSTEIGERLGLSTRTIEYDLALYRRLLPGVRETLCGHPILRNAAQLRALAKLAPYEQERIAARLAAGEIAKVAEGVARQPGQAQPAPLKEQQRVSIILKHLAGLSDDGLRALFQALARDHAPALRAALRRADETTRG